MKGRKNLLIFLSKDKIKLMLRKHKITKKLILQAIAPPDPNSHKGQNGRVLIIGGSPLFHGAGRLASKAAWEVILSFTSRANDMVYFCSTKKNLDYLKCQQECFIGIIREQVNSYLKICDVVLVGTGLMREPEVNWAETKKEPLITKELTKKVLQSNKKAVLDAGSLQVVSLKDLKGKKKIIITPHQKEMSKLFNITPELLTTFHNSSLEKIKKVASIVKKTAEKYQITILLKGPVDIIADQQDWYYSEGGNAGMTKGGTGDVLAGIVTAFYGRSDNPLLAAATASFICKKTGEDLWKKKKWLYNATDLSRQLNKTIIKII